MIDAEVQAVIDSLEGRLNTALAKIRDLEDTMDYHVGTDYGANQQNAPHPNMSVDTIESGGGIIRQDRYGMQVLAPSSDFVPSVYFVQELGNFSTPLSQISGYSDASIPQTELMLLSDAFNGNAIAQIRTVSTDVSSTVTISGTSPAFPSGATLGVLVTALACYVYINNGPLLLASAGSDYASLANDGAIQYRSDTDKFRGRANSTTDNFAMEAWVTAGFVAGTGSETDYAHSLMLMGA